MRGHLAPVACVALDRRNPRRNPHPPAFTDIHFQVLAYSIIMLTTNLHSSKVKKKMTLFEFIRQNKTVNDGHNFPGDFLADVYDAISAQELKVGNDT